MSNYNKGKSFGRIFLAIIAVFCLILDGWFAYIHFFGKEKVVSTTATFSDLEVEKIDQITGEVVTEQKTFLEVNKFDNCIEIKFNQLYDENQTAFYSYGIQLMVKDNVEKTLASENIFNGNYTKEIYSEQLENDKLIYESLLYLQKCKVYHDVYNKVVTDKNYTYLDLYEYQSFDNYETPLQSTFLQDGNQMFKLQAKNGAENKIYALKFENYETEYEIENKTFKEKLITKNLINVGNEIIYSHDKYGVFSLSSYYDEVNYFRANDIYYFIESIANSINGLAPGFIGETYLRLPSCFDLYEYDESKQAYSNIGDLNDLTSKIDSENIIYSKIKLTVHEGNLTKSSQSFFNKYREIQNYDSNPDDADMTDYLTGKNLITATLLDLDWEATSQSGVYIFSLSDAFKLKWKDFKTSSFVKILIDVEFLNKNNLSYGGFDLDEDYFIYQVKTTQNDILYQGVNYV